MKRNSKFYIQWLEGDLRKRRWSTEDIRKEIEEVMDEQDKKERLNREKIGGFDTTGWERKRTIYIRD